MQVGRDRARISRDRPKGGIRKTCPTVHLTQEAIQMSSIVYAPTFIINCVLKGWERTPGAPTEAD